LSLESCTRLYNVSYGASHGCLAGKNATPCNKPGANRVSSGQRLVQLAGTTTARLDDGSMSRILQEAAFAM